MECTSENSMRNHKWVQSDIIHLRLISVLSSVNYTYRYAAYSCGEKMSICAPGFRSGICLGPLAVVIAYYVESIPVLRIICTNEFQFVTSRSQTKWTPWIAFVARNKIFIVLKRLVYIRARVLCTYICIRTQFNWNTRCYNTHVHT